MDHPDDREGDDPLEGIEERLQSRDNALQSLLALTPARDHHGSHVVDGQDPSEQWNRKKQTKDQKKAAKRAKLDPRNNKSALDVLKEREAEALKRKRGDNEENADDEETVGNEVTQKRQKGEDDADAAEARRRLKAEKKKEKRQAKKEKKAAKQAKAEGKKSRKQESQLNEAVVERRSTAGEDGDESDEENEDAEEISAERMAGMGNMDFSGLVNGHDPEIHDGGEDDAASHASTAPTTPVIESPAFDLGTNHSAASSSSSIVPPSTANQQKPQPALQLATAAPASTAISSPKPNIPKLTDAEKQERLRARIEALRAARKADDKPAQSRQELVEQRRKKDEQRKAHKKELRAKAKEEQARRQEEQLRGSGSPLSVDIFSPRSPLPTDNSYSFSRLAFEDGTAADASLTELKDPLKKKGPRDAKTALQAAQSKHSRLAGFDPAKRADIEDKDMWLNARKRAHGERVRDDTSLLKKALKRKEKAKSKSEAQWKERGEAVVKGREMKQKKREGNLAKRKEEKGGGGKGGKKKAGGAKGAKKGKPKKRAGFEGSFRA